MSKRNSRVAVELCSQMASFRMTLFLIVTVLNLDTWRHNRFEMFVIVVFDAKMSHYSQTKKKYIKLANLHIVT